MTIDWNRLDEECKKEVKYMYRKHYNTCIYRCDNSSCDKLDDYYCKWDIDELAMKHCPVFSSFDG